MRGSLIRGMLLATAVLTLSMVAAACGSTGDAPAEDAPAASATPTAAAIATGDTVAATWIDGNLYLATVTAVDGDSVKVEYSDDGSSATVPAAEVRAIPTTSFAIGDRVLAVWSKGRFHAGKITGASGTSYVVEWDDGSAPSTVEAGQVIAP